MASKEAMLSLLSLWMHAWEIRPIVKTKMHLRRFPGRARIFRRKILSLWLWQNLEAHTFKCKRLRNLADRRARRSKFKPIQRYSTKEIWKNKQKTCSYICCQHVKSRPRSGSRPPRPMYSRNLIHIRSNKFYIIRHTNRIIQKAKIKGGNWGLLLPPVILACIMNSSPAIGTSLKGICKIW